MNQVDIYIGDYRLDLFQDEEISINLSVQNIQDLSKVFTDFTQSFTVPASGWNNEILRHYYRTDVDAVTVTKKNPILPESLFEAYEARVKNAGGVVEARDCCIGALEALGGSFSSKSYSNSFDFRLRPQARIEINALPFREGVLEMENVLIQNNEPYAYSLSFYGSLVSLADLMGEDYLFDLDLSAYDHSYDGATIIQGFNQEALFGGNVFYPLMSPKNNWYYNSSVTDATSTNIATNKAVTPHGVYYDELKPAIKVVKLLEAMESKYGITFSGSFMSDDEFNKLYLWAHRFEGYLFDSTTTIPWRLINFNRNTGSGSQFNLTTDTWTVQTASEYQLRVQVSNTSADYELGLFLNGELLAVAREFANVGTNTSFFDGFIFQAGDEIQLKIRPQSPTSMTYQVDDYTGYTAPDGIPVLQQFEVDQSSSASYTFSLEMSPLMPEIKVVDFLAGIIKMHNLVIVPISQTEFSLQTLNDWYASGTNVDLSSNMNVDEISVNRPQLYREIEFQYQETDQILGFEYARTNLVGFGDLESYFSWDGETYNIKLPFECPLFERQTDTNTNALTNVLAYKSITNQVDDTGGFNAYLGSPILIYGEFSVDISANPINFVDESNTETQCDEIWYANTSSTSIGTGLAYSLTWGADLDPYYLEPIGKSLYQTYWESYIVDLYNSKRRVVQVEGILPLGRIINLQLNNKIVWNNQRWIVNTVNVNMTTGRSRFELLNDV